MMMVPVLYLDIDGTVRHGRNELGHFVNGPNDVVIFPEAVQLMRRWKTDGGRIIGVSNQGGIALGHLDAGTCTAAMRRTNGLSWALFDDIRVCPHHPNAPNPAMRHCLCRKPLPGLVVNGTEDLALRFPDETYPTELALMVGDRPEDEKCARAAGIAFQWATDWRALATWPAGHAPVVDPRGDQHGDGPSEDAHQ
jgi:D-glycero-D-manno-heptose 1,7-bisphosphate phosphatase